MIRPARAEDVRRPQEVETAAGRAFREVGMDWVADDPPPGEHELLAFVRAGRAWVVEHRGAVAAYLVAEVVDDAVHVEQVSVHPDHAGHGLGRGLVDHAAAWGRDRGLAAQTLTTFDGVPWNRRYYERLGFEVVDDAALAPGLRAVREAETARGLDRSARVAMRRPLPPA